MTFGEKLRNVLASAKSSAPAGSWNGDAWVRTVNDFVEHERPLRKDGTAKKPKRQLPINKMTEDEFMDYLRLEPTLVGIDLEKEIGKCKFHFKAKGITVSRMRLINWLGRAEKSLSNHGRDAGARAASLNERSTGAPHGWAEEAKAMQRQWGIDNGGDVNGTAEYAIRNNDFFQLPESWRVAIRRKIDGR